MMLLHGSSKRWVSSLVWKRPTRPLGNMVSSVTYIGLGSEADCRFLCLSISETAEFGFEWGTHSLMNFTQKKESQLVVSWLLHALDWRLTSCHLLLPWSGDLFLWALPWHYLSIFQCVAPSRDWCLWNGVCEIHWLKKFPTRKSRWIHISKLATILFHLQNNPHNGRWWSSLYIQQEAIKYLYSYSNEPIKFRKFFAGRRRPMAPTSAVFVTKKGLYFG